MGTIIDIVMKKLNEKSSSPQQDSDKTLDSNQKTLREKLKNVSLPTLFTALVGIFVTGAVANTARTILMKAASERFNI